MVCEELGDSRGENHLFRFSQPLTDEPHLKVETLHPVLITPYGVRVLVVDEFRTTNVANESTKVEVD